MIHDECWAATKTNIVSFVSYIVIATITSLNKFQFLCSAILLFACRSSYFLWAFSSATARRQRPCTACRDATKIDGKAIAASIREDIRQRVQHYQETIHKVPGLAVILVGSRRDSQTYVNMKKKACEAAGIRSVGYDFAENLTQDELLETVDTLNRDASVHGILVQLPLPPQIDQDKVLQSVDPSKDVDGLHPVNVAKLQLYAGEATAAPFSIPCTPLGCLVLLDRVGVDLRGKHCVVIGRSSLVGLPMARLLLGRDATVTICHSKTPDLGSVVQQADVVVAAVGKSCLVQGDWIKPGAIVIDVGINSVDIEPKKPGGKTYKLVGDVDFCSASPVASFITPVPGGVGPMTIAMLLNNTLASFERSF